MHWYKNVASREEGGLLAHTILLGSRGGIKTRKSEHGRRVVSRKNGKQVMKAYKV